MTRSGAAVLILLAAGCRTGPQHSNVIGQAYVGPAVLKIRGDLPMDSPVTATVKHGDRVDILQRRRIFLRVRTASGAEGWTEARQLLAESDMAGLKALSERAAKIPVQGQASSYSDLNVHTEPSTQAPSFLRIKAQERFDVLGHIAMPRTEIPRAPLIPPVPKKPPAEKKESRSKSKIPPPPLPKPPGAPPNWLELSKPELDESADTEESAADSAKTAKPAPTDDWSLVRTASGQTGWVLTRRLTMAIPDEVAQYAEGHRIVSYFSLGKIQDSDQQKDVWLWTTIANGVHPFDFDSIRVFVWSIRHHRYETAHIERGLQGYSPVLLTNVDYAPSGGGRTHAAAAAKFPGFSVCVDNRDGQRVRRRYALLANVVRFAGEQPCEPAAPPYTLSKTPSAGQAAASQPAAAPAKPSGGLITRWKERLKTFFHR